MYGDIGRIQWACKYSTNTTIGGFVVAYSAAAAIIKAYGVNGEEYVVLLNIGITFVEVLLALYVNISYSNPIAKMDNAEAVTKENSI